MNQNASNKEMWNDRSEIYDYDASHTRQTPPLFQPCSVLFKPVPPAVPNSCLLPCSLFLFHPPVPVPPPVQLFCSTSCSPALLTLFMFLFCSPCCSTLPVPVPPQLKFPVPTSVTPVPALFSAPTSTPAPQFQLPLHLFLPVLFSPVPPHLLPPTPGSQAVPAPSSPPVQPVPPLFPSPAPTPLPVPVPPQLHHQLFHPCSCSCSHPCSHCLTLFPTPCSHLFLHSTPAPAVPPLFHLPAPCLSLFPTPPAPLFPNSLFPSSTPSVPQPTSVLFQQSVPSSQPVPSSSSCSFLFTPAPSPAACLLPQFPASQPTAVPAAPAQLCSTCSTPSPVPHLFLPHPSCSHAVHLLFLFPTPPCSVPHQPSTVS
ncbi:uncharacterized protein LOC134222673 [Armigeres subalbatus]|uniref:uncharacterized protein LOC134222673 n=1 Tax=Armigeres subalbatus TaxID=124917 RepID=UPI002ED642B1